MLSQISHGDFYKLTCNEGSELNQMAKIKEDFQIIFLISISLFLVFSSSCDAHQFLRMCKFDSIYQLGDSLADTGNRIIENSLGTACSKFPYGETFFNHLTGRCSNGLLMIDYVGKHKILFPPSFCHISRLIREVSTLYKYELILFY